MPKDGSTASRPIAIFIDADACPVRDEIFQVADRRGLRVFVVANGSRPLSRPRSPNAEVVLVPDGADKADDWIAEHVGEGDVCVTADIPLASRCLAAGAKAVSPRGHRWSEDNIGAALAGRDLARHLREMGQETRHAPMGKADRSRFLIALDAALTERPRPPTARGAGGVMPGWDG
jgi:uncharacterized protein YaiI (UPF0178 family)